MPEANVKAGRIRVGTRIHVHGVEMWTSSTSPWRALMGKAPDDDRGGLRVDGETSFGSSTDETRNELDTKGSRSDKLPQRAVCAL